MPTLNSEYLLIAIFVIMTIIVCVTAFALLKQSSWYKDNDDLNL